MLDWIWAGMLLAGILCACCTGRLGEVSQAVLEGAQSGVELSLALLGSLCAWTGFLKIADGAGITRWLALALGPLLGRLFPEYREDPEIQGKICMNLAANILGVGNAATPLGLAAMEAMKKRSPEALPTRGMILFVVLNTASLQLLPMNMAGLRAAAGSAEPFAILPQVWLTSAGALLAAVTACKLLERRARPWRG